MKLVLTCEHGGNKIPTKYLPLFADAQEALNSHRGLDPGALDLFHHLSKLARFSQYNTISRLLIEINRSQGHPKLYSEFTTNLSGKAKIELIESIYFPYRYEVEKNISKLIAKGEEVLHFSVHSFTPVWKGESRNTDIGLLYDPSKGREKSFCKNFKQQLLLQSPSLKIRYNYPYLGIADGFTTYLRNEFPKKYSGIELEVNQKFTSQNKMEPGLKISIYNALEICLKKNKGPGN
jgi:predicted N-formylglutamate amidohydrolase